MLTVYTQLGVMEIIAKRIVGQARPMLIHF